MFYQILPNAIFIVAILGIILMILRHLPEAASMQRQEAESSVEKKLTTKGLPIQALSRLKPVFKLWLSRIWNFILEAKDLKPSALPGYKIKKIFGNRINPLPKKQPAAVLPVNMQEVRNEKYFLDIIKKEPKNFSHYDALGKFYLDTGNFSDAKDIYLYLTNHQATNGDYHARLAFSLYQLEQYEKAVEHYQKSLALDSAQPSRYYNMGLSLEAAGKTEEAIKAFEQAIALEPNNPKFYGSLSNAYKKIGDKAKARETMEKASHLAPVAQNKKIKVN